MNIVRESVQGLMRLYFLQHNCLFSFSRIVRLNIILAEPRIYLSISCTMIANSHDLILYLEYNHALFKVDDLIFEKKSSIVIIYSRLHCWSTRSFLEIICAAAQSMQSH